MTSPVFQIYLPMVYNSPLSVRQHRWSLPLAIFTTLSSNWTLTGACATLVPGHKPIEPLESWNKRQTKNVMSSINCRMHNQKYIIKIVIWEKKQPTNKKASWMLLHWMHNGVNRLQKKLWIYTFGLLKKPWHTLKVPHK